MAFKLPAVKTSYIIIGILAVIVIYLVLQSFKKDIKYEVYRAKIEAKQEAYKELEAERADIKKAKDSLNANLGVSTAVREADLQVLRDMILKRPNTIIYDKKIDDIRHYGSPELYEYFTDLR